MLVKTSKETTDRQKAFVFLHSVFLLQGPTVAQTLTELCHPADPEDEAVTEEPDFLSVILGFGRSLKERLTRLVAADEDHYEDKADFHALIEQRDSLSRTLTGQIVAMRRLVLGHHEKPDLRRLGLEGGAAREPVPVLRQADRIVKILAKGELEEPLGPPTFEGTPFEPKDRGQQIKTVADKLREVVDEVGGVKRRTEDAFLKKQEATKSYDQLFIRAARTFEDWCRLIGRDELADRIRPSEKRPGRTVQEPPAPSEEAAEAASSEASPKASAKAPEKTSVSAPSAEALSTDAPEGAPAKAPEESADSAESPAES